MGKVIKAGVNGEYYTVERYEGQAVCKICGADCNNDRLAKIRDIVICSTCVFDLIDALDIDIAI